MPTKKGATWLKDQKFDLHHFNGIHYHAVEPVFIRRLLLLIQTMTNAANNYFSFIPIEDDRLILNWVKKIYRQNNHPEKVLERLYYELFSLLSNIHEEQAEMFVDRITGYLHYGASIRQLSQAYNLSVDDVHLKLTLVNHRMIQMISDSDAYPFMQKVLTGIEQPSTMSHSASQTYDMIKKKYTPEEISVARGLKLNTVYDHIVEIIYFDPNIPSNRLSPVGRKTE
nr:helix-turn-helix domain-containing protein [Lentibacillus sp. JNUCC-1]